MPIDYKRYPANWKSEIVPRIRERAGDKCEWCGVSNHRIGWRDAEGQFHDMQTSGVEQYIHDREHPKFKGLIRIVCTVVHVKNEDPQDVRDENLAYLCQRCHNRHDGIARSKRRKAKRGGV